MTAQEMWNDYSQKYGIDSPYEAWSFGDDPDSLATLVLEGTKTATSSAYVWYDLEGEPLPEEGQYSVILNRSDEAVCIIQTRKIYVTSFENVSADHAYKEGEGDRSLAYWRQVHQRFFSQELLEIKQEFKPQMLVVCEEFVRVYP